MGYVPIRYKSLPRRMKLPLKSGAGMRLASFEVHGCMEKGYVRMKFILEVGTGCVFAGTNHAHYRHPNMHERVKKNLHISECPEVRLERCKI